MNRHETEEAEFGRGPRLWDAGEGVCCAAYQLGACAHTEAFDEPAADGLAVLSDAWADGLHGHRAVTWVAGVPLAVPPYGWLVVPVFNAVWDAVQAMPGGPPGGSEAV